MDLAGERNHSKARAKRPVEFGCAHGSRQDSKARLRRSSLSKARTLRAALWRQTDTALIRQVLISMYFAQVLDQFMQHAHGDNVFVQVGQQV